MCSYFLILLAKISIYVCNVVQCYQYIFRLCGTGKLSSKQNISIFEWKYYSGMFDKNKTAFCYFELENENILAWNYNAQIHGKERELDNFKIAGLIKEICVFMQNYAYKIFKVLTIIASEIFIYLSVSQNFKICSWQISCFHIKKLIYQDSSLIPK